MKAQEVMTSNVVSAKADTPVPEIARLLLQNHISALPILDDRRAPIGMVSEGDLVGRDETARDARRDWWLALMAEGKPLGAAFLSGLRRPDRTANDVMSSPVISVGEDADTSEIARVLRSYRIKRVPVIRDGQVVGIVSRENLLRAVADEEPHHNGKHKEGALASALADAFASLDRHFERPHHKSQLRATPTTSPNETCLTVVDFRRLVTDCESKQVQARAEQHRSAAEERRHRVEELCGRHISDESWRNLLHEARTAAQRGEKEFMLLRFPSQLCSDGGRAVNVPDQGWPATLRGEAAEIYLRWSRDLKPRGFHLAARVVDFPDGVPGDIGLFLVWGAE